MKAFCVTWPQALSQALPRFAREQPDGCLQVSAYVNSNTGMSSIRVSSKQSCGPLIPRGRAHVVLGLEPLETVRVLQKYGNPDVACITNTHPVFPMAAIISEDNVYPGPDTLRQTITGLSKTAWFVDAASIALELGAPIVVNIGMMGALLGAALLPPDAADLGAEIRDSFPAEAAELNLRALKRGIDAVAPAR